MPLRKMNTERLYLLYRECLKKRGAHGQSAGKGGRYLSYRDSFSKDQGGKHGQRLPTTQEWVSLLGSTQPSPYLPPRNPFSNMLLSDYWPATTYAMTV